MASSPGLETGLWNSENGEFVVVELGILGCFMVILWWFYGDSKELIRRGGSKGQTSLCETGA